MTKQSNNKIACTSNNNKIYHNLDTFCNICKKELCNKYFLKTHLANKHGIILQNDDLNSSLIQNPTTTTTTSNSSNSNNQIAYSPKTIKSSSSPNYIQNEVDNELLKSELNEDVDDDENNRSIVDFCELCKKQFCNKYYLKKHKFDVHGVLIENGIKSYKRISSETAISSSYTTVPSISTTNTSTSLVNHNNSNTTTTNSSNSSLISSSSSSSTNSKNIFNSLQQQVNSNLIHF